MNFTENARLDFSKRVVRCNWCQTWRNVLDLSVIWADQLPDETVGWSSLMSPELLPDSSDSCLTPVTIGSDIAGRFTLVVTLHLTYSSFWKRLTLAVKPLLTDVNSSPEAFTGVQRIICLPVYLLTHTHLRFTLHFYLFAQTSDHYANLLHFCSYPFSNHMMLAW